MALGIQNSRYPQNFSNNLLLLSLDIEKDFLCVKKRWKSMENVDFL